MEKLQASGTLKEKKPKKKTHGRSLHINADFEEDDAPPYFGFGADEDDDGDLAHSRRKGKGAGGKGGLVDFTAELPEWKSSSEAESSRTKHAKLEAQREKARVQAPKREAQPSSRYGDGRRGKDDSDDDSDDGARAKNGKEKEKALVYRQDDIPILEAHRERKAAEEDRRNKKARRIEKADGIAQDGARRANQAADDADDVSNENTILGAFMSGRRDLDAASSLGSRDAAWRAGGGAGGGGGDMWELDEIGDGDGRSSSYSISLPEVAKPTDANLALRTDKFMQFLSLACGHPGMSLAGCFVMTPPPDCSELEQYMLYLHPTAKSAAVQTNTFVKRFSGGTMNLGDCIDLDRWDDLMNSSSQLYGAFLRKTISDNPIKTVPTRFASEKVQMDMNNSLRQMFADIKHKVQGNLGGAFMRQISASMAASSAIKRASTDWMHVT